MIRGAGDKQTIVCYLQWERSNERTTMAKAKLTVGVVTSIDYAAIYWPHATNTRLSVGEGEEHPLADLDNTFSPDGEATKGEKQFPEGLVLPLMRGWQPRENVSVMTVEDYCSLHKTTPEQLAIDCQAEREAQIAEWQASERTKGLANVATRCWFPNGKMLPIQAVGQEAFRRSIGIMGAIYKRTEKPIFDDTLQYPVQVVVVGFATKLDALMSHVLENTGKDLGKRNYRPLDYLKIALMAWHADRAKFSEATLVKMGVSRGTAQKVFAVAKLSVANPDQKIAERVFLTPPPVGTVVEYRKPETNGPDDVGSYLPLERFDKEITRRVVENYEIDDTNKAGGVLPLGNQTANVEKLLSRVSGGKQLAATRMSGTEIGKWENSPVYLLKYIAKAIASNDSQAIKTLENNFQALNAVYLDIFPAERGTEQPKVDAA